MPRRILILAAALALASLPALSHAGCKDDWLCIDEIASGRDVTFRARNLRDFPITYTLRVEARQFSISGPNTVTRTLDPRESQQVMRLHGRDGGNGVYRYDFKWTVGRMDAKHDDSYLYALPYGAGTSYRVLQGYGSRFSHQGNEEFAVDFDMQPGTAVHAARSGIVARIEESNSKGCWEDECGQYANFVVILHPDGTTGEYYHLEHNGVLVDVGDRVERGQIIALSGNTGHTTMPHLHFAVYRPISWGRTQSIPVRFQSADGIIDRPRRGGRYPALPGNEQ
jgi:murein DD-endopeptidase MepM/ murein hydrolase activator NlpD